MGNINSISDKEARRRWVVLVVAYLCLLTYAIMLQSVPPVLSLVMAELELSHAQGGLLMSLFAVPGIIASIPAGMLADRYGQRKIGIASFSITVAGAAVFALGDSLAVLALGRIVSGIGAVTLWVLAPQLVAQWFAGREMGLAMGVFTTGMPLGTILSLNFLSTLGESAGWRASAWLSAGMALVMLIVVASLFTPAPGKKTERLPKAGGLFQGIRLTGTSIWTVGVAWALFNAAAISLFSFTPDFLTSVGFSVSSAGFFTSAVMWPALVLGLVIGYVIDKIDRKRTFIVIGGLAVATLVVLVPTATGWILTIMLLIGAGMILVPTPIFALAPEVVNPERLGLGYGIISTCLNLGIVLGPALVGLIRDVTGSYQAGYALMAGFAFLVVPTILILRRRQG